MFDIIEPQENSVEGFTMQIADETRRALSEMLPAPVEQENKTPTAPAKEEIKAARDSGKAVFAAALSAITPTMVIEAGVHLRRSFDLSIGELEPHIKLVGALNSATREVARGGVSNRPYVLDGIFNAAKAHMFQQGIKFDTPQKVNLLVGMGSAPRATAHPTDVANSVLSPQGRSAGFLYNMREITEDAFEGYRYVRYAEGCLFALEGVHSTEADTAMFHGFVGVDNLTQLRWQNLRMGVAVKQATGSDEEARRAADLFRDVKSYTFKLYPNDVAFGPVYVDFDDDTKSSGLGSCMSGDDCSNVPYGVHPCDAYSSAHFGAGDNGLVLVVAYKGDLAVGRGILNVQNKQVVRWYGNYRASVQFFAATGTEDESAALEGSWLALIEQDGRFAHPYIDSDSEYGSLDRDAGRVVLFEGTFDLQNTRGYSHAVETRICCYDDEWYPESEMTYQEHTDTWIADRNIRRAYTCAITGEHLHRYSMHKGTVDGDVVWVADGIDPEDFGYQRLCGDIGWTNDLSQYTYDDVSERWYTNSDYEELMEAREEEGQNDEDSNANAA